MQRSERSGMVIDSDFELGTMAAMGRTMETNANKLVVVSLEERY